MLRLMTPAQLRDVTERELQAALIAEAERLGWRCWFVQRSIGSPKGWPDLALTRPPELVYVELKAERGQLTGPQRGCLAALRACGQRVYVWKPSDVAEAEAVLRGEAVASVAGTRR